MEEVQEDKQPHSVVTPNPPQVMDPSAHPTNPQRDDVSEDSDETKEQQATKKPAAKVSKKTVKKAIPEKTDEDRKLAPREEL